MKNILDAEGRDMLSRRLRTLEKERPARWGRMDVSQMVCHVGDPLRIALGEITAADASSFVTRNVLKRLVLWGMPAPKGKIQTFPEIDQVAGGGTRPGELADDVAAFDELVDRFVARVPGERELAPNPIFGPLTASEWGRLVWVHAHHHLNQFGA